MITEREVLDRAEGLVTYEVLACQSFLISELMRRGDVDGFTVDDVEFNPVSVDDLQFDVWFAGDNMPGCLPDESYYPHESSSDAWAAVFDSMESHLETYADSPEYDDLEAEYHVERDSVDTNTEGCVMWAGRAWCVEQGVSTGDELRDLRNESSRWSPFDDGFESHDGTTEDDLNEFPEIYEWWLVSNWLASELRDHNQPILDNDYGVWWGRCTTGQSISMDGVIQDIARSILAS